jgi:hypothetical protein
MLLTPLLSILVYLALQSATPSTNPFAPDRIARIESFKRRAPALVSRFEKRVYKDQSGNVMPYRLFRPERIVNSRKYPLVLFLHGAAGSGTDGEKQLQGANMFGGLVWALPENQKRFSAFVVAPQSNINWPAAKIEPGRRPVLIPGLGLGSRLALEIVEQLVSEFPIDSARIYVTGHSMGGPGLSISLRTGPGSLRLQCQCVDCPISRWPRLWPRRPSGISTVTRTTSSQWRPREGSSRSFGKQAESHDIRSIQVWNTIHSCGRIRNPVSRNGCSRSGKSAYRGLDSER